MADAATIEKPGKLKAKYKGWTGKLLINNQWVPAAGGSTFDQQCGSIWHGRGRWLIRFKILNTPTPTRAAPPAAPTAANLCAPPNANNTKASEYHSQPSPMRVAASIQ